MLENKDGEKRITATTSDYFLLRRPVVPPRKEDEPPMPELAANNFPPHFLGV